VLKKITFILIVLSIVLLILRRQPEPKTSPSPIPLDQIYKGVSYEPVNPDEFSVDLLSDHLISPTRIRLLPDQNHLLISQLTGEIIAFKRTGKDTWARQIDPVVNIPTHFPGFPPDEGGLTGITISADFDKNHTIFLSYSFKDKGGKTLNRISSSVLKDREGKLIGANPRLIYEANIDGAPSHQIQEAISVKINGAPHLIFPIGEGFKGERAQDPSLEAGKIILIKETGENPDGQHPFANPKIAALGIRNAFTLAQNSYDPLKRILIADTGPDHFDRLIYTTLYSQTSDTQKPLNFLWDGKEDTLKNPVPDPNHRDVKDSVIFRLPETRTFTGLIFHPGGKKGIPISNSDSQSLIATIFGKTGWPDPSPGKEIWLGRLTNTNSQPKISFSPIIRRTKKATGKLGNPIGLELDAQNGNFFFADVLEGRLYLVKPK